MGDIALTNAAMASAPASQSMFFTEKVLWLIRPLGKPPTQT
jgi:hypothetical protein